MTQPAFRLAVNTVLGVLADLFRLASLLLQSRATLAAENLFLRKQLALYLERQVKPRCATMLGTRRIVDWNVTMHPTADWTTQQFRMVIAGDEPHSFVIHDRDSIYSEGVDRTLAAMGLTVLRTPVRAPQANAFCERLVGTIRRDCLDFVIPLSERHLRWILQRWVAPYNRGRPHASMGPGIPDSPTDRVVASSGHTLSEAHRVVATPILGGLHHEYRLEPKAA
jgi:putative transposase